MREWINGKSPTPLGEICERDGASLLPKLHKNTAEEAGMVSRVRDTSSLLLEWNLEIYHY